MQALVAGSEGRDFKRRKGDLITAWHASRCHLGEINVTPKVGEVECGLTPLTADMSNA